MNDRLKQIVINKLESDLVDAVFFPYGRELWILNIEKREWYFQTDSMGLLWYNQIFFNNFFSLFSCGYKEYQPVLLRWFELLTGFNQRSISRRNSDVGYIIDKMLKDNKKNWTLFERYGFAYQIVKKYCDMKKNLNVDTIKISNFYGNQI